MADDRGARFEALYAMYARSVLLYARRRADAETAADVVSQVFVIAWQRMERIPTDPLPWLLLCARRELGHERRAQGRRDRLAEQVAAGTPGASPALELRDRPLLQALARLGEVDREVLLLTAWEGLSVADASRVMRCSTAAFRVRAHRARKRLSQELLLDGHGGSAVAMEVCND